VRCASCGLRVAGCELRVAGCGLRVAGCGLRVAGCAGVATGSILVYAYILMYYTKERGFKGGGYLKVEGEGVFGVGRQSLKSD